MGLFRKKAPNRDSETMAKQQQKTPRDDVISIIAPGMRVQGDCTTDGTLRVEGIVEGAVTAGKAVVVGKDGCVAGDIHTQDAVIGGKVTGSIVAESRLELQEACEVQGEIRARRIKLDEGGNVDGKITTGEIKLDESGKPEKLGKAERKAEGKAEGKAEDKAEDMPGERAVAGAGSSQAPQDAGEAAKKAPAGDSVTG